MHERLKKIRKNLRLTQEFVAKQMGMSRTTIVAIESGNRDVTAAELAAFSDLYGVPMEELIHGNVTNEGKAVMFARTFSELSDMDQAEIISLMRFKKRYKESLHA
jgi:transcriptional regulator with XRE-family HTH domain